MPRPLLDSEYLHGLHDPGGEQHMLDLGKAGWVLFTEGIGDDPDDGGGHDYRPFSDRGLGVISRLNHGYFPSGTIPHSGRYREFARRCARFVAASPGCRIWIIGNEMNLSSEWPLFPGRGAERGGPSPEQMRASPERFGALHETESAARSLQEPSAAASRGDRPRPEAEVITAQLYALCFRLCRDAIRSTPGHEGDQVVVGAVAPWNPDVGDWVGYLEETLNLIGPGGCDGIALHTYTHGPEPERITDAKRMDPPYAHRHYHFLAYRDFMQVIPDRMRHLPVYITETDQNDAWKDGNDGWVRAAYREIDRWNQTPGNQQIRSLILYRWPVVPGDKWHFEDKAGVIEDFRQAVSEGFQWRAEAWPLFKTGDTVFTRQQANLRETPGYVGKPKVEFLVPAGSALSVRGGPKLADGLQWWQLEYDDAPAARRGWMAQAIPGGPILFSAAAPRGLPSPAQPPAASRGAADPAIGDLVFAAGALVPRRSPGIVGKAEDDILPYLPYGAALVLAEGPVALDGADWWRVEVVSDDADSDPAASGGGWLVNLMPDGSPALAWTALEALAWPGQAATRGGEAVLAIGEHARVVAPAVRVRAAPGLTGEVVGRAVQGTMLRLGQGPQAVDNLLWWQVEAAIQGQAPSGWVAQADGDGNPLLQPTQLPAGGTLGVPVEGTARVTQGFGDNPAFYATIKYSGVPLKGHHGMDFGLPVGTPILSTADGEVFWAGWDKTGFGNLVKLRHEWGESIYAHLSRIDVPFGARVRRGDTLGLSGNTGLSTGPHLHFGTRFNPYVVTDGWGGFSDPASQLGLGSRGLEPAERGMETDLVPELLVDFPGAVAP